MATEIFNDKHVPDTRLYVNGTEIAVRHPGYTGLPFSLNPEDLPRLLQALGVDNPEPMFKPNASFDDIREGDTVRTTFTLNGVTTTHEGTADHLFGGWWRTSDGEGLVSDPSADPTPNRAVHILDRPDPAEASE